MLNLSKCKASGKTRYASPGEAKEAMLKLKAKKNAYDSTTRKRIKRRGGKPAQCRHYHCVHCNGFHLTSSSTGVTQNQIQNKIIERVKSTEGLVLSKEQAANWKVDSLPFPNNQITQNDKLI
jgi:hypothetical protein